MDSNLPATGTAQLLILLSPYVPDSVINDLMPRHRDRGRRQQFSAAQLYRIHLLSVLTPVHSFNHLVRLLAEQRAWRRFAHLSNRHAIPDVWMLNQFRERVGVSGLRQINERLLERVFRKLACDFSDLRGFGGSLFGAQKKTTGKYSASQAALGGRTLKCGQSRFFVGYKKHTFRLWLQQYRRGVLLVPLVTWIAPANYGEGGFLKPSVIYCQRRWDWYPNIIVADMGYIEAGTKRQLRETRGIAVVTRLKENMLLVPPFESCEHAVCGQGQRLQWLGYEAADQLHWFGVTDGNPLCQWCWESAQCARQFSHSPAEHETLLGLIPMNTRASQRLLQQVRPWIEPAQSYEKNQLGLGAVFLNSLRLTWSRSLLADAAVLLRARLILEMPGAELPMFELTPSQLALDLEN